jgi:hypothetical protein
VSLSGKTAFVRTDARGAFTLTGLPTDPPEVDLLIRSGSSRMQARVALADDPVLVTYQPEGV